MRLSVRRVRGFVAITTVAALVGACKDNPVDTGPTQEIIDNATIELFPPTGPSETITPGMHALGLAAPRDGFLYVPSTYDPSVKAPLIVLFHGAGGSSALWNTPELITQYEANGLLVLATDSRYETWDFRVIGEYRDDVDFLQEALEYVFRVANVDPARMSIGGFSDGASEALGVGAVNAHLFSRIVAMSPGQLYVPFNRGTPGIFIAHGVEDDILPFAYTRDVIVTSLARNGYNVNFQQFTGGHMMPSNLLSQALQWAAAPRTIE